MSAPLLSICIPTFNRAAHLEHALQSVCHQMRTDMEVVVSDNASTDNTKALVERFANQYPHIRYSRSATNIGPDRNFLRVIDIARGDFCWYLGSDDTLLPGAVQAIWPHLDRADLIVVDSVNSTSFDPLPKLERRLSSPPGTLFNCAVYDDLESFFHHATKLGDMFSFISCLILRRDIWQQQPIRPEFLGSAWIHVTKAFDVMRNNGRVLYLGEALVSRLEGNDSFLLYEGHIGRRTIDFDFIRVGETVFSDHPIIKQTIADIVIRNHFSTRQVLSDKLYSFREGGPNGQLRMMEAYKKYFAAAPGFRKRVFAWRVFPTWLLAIYHRAKQYFTKSRRDNFLEGRAP